MILLLLAICAAPVIASYLTYYVFKPQGGSTNYGELITPQRPVPDGFVAHDANGAMVPSAAFHGKWLLVSVGPSACDDSCATRLYFTRQIRATQGAERERVETVWLRTDAGPIAPRIQAAYADTHAWVVDPAALARWFPADAGTAISDHIYVIDPNGNLMMQFPKNADPSKIKNDVTKLLKLSSIG
jgi:cytochrome oxidase Cu insertion factor (SCO1/SenC/PrrC family)